MFAVYESPLHTHSTMESQLSVAARRIHYTQISIPFYFKKGFVIVSWGGGYKKKKKETQTHQS